MKGDCTWGNEISGSTNCEELLDWLWPVSFLGKTALLGFSCLVGWLVGYLVDRLVS